MESESCMDAILASEIVIKSLCVDDISPDLLVQFVHSQKITKRWEKREGVWEIADTDLLREWSAEKKTWITEYMREQINRGGITVGAFCGERLIGFCCMDGTISGSCAKYVNLTMLFVDDNWKRSGIGKRLFLRVREHAEKLGAEKIFISAIPSVDTVAFYTKMGCVDACEIIENFVDTESDRYLELVIKEKV